MLPQLMLRCAQATTTLPLFSIRSTLLGVQATNPFGALANAANERSLSSSNNGSARQPVPSEIRVKKKEKCLEFLWDSSERMSLPAELLRVRSPSADTDRLDAHGRPRVVAGRKHVGILGVEPVGSYAIRIKFDDLHQTGIYTWDYLYDLGKRQEHYMKLYVEDLEARGLSREPAASARASGRQQAAQAKSQQQDKVETQARQRSQATSGGGCGRDHEHDHNHGDGSKCTGH